MSPFSHPRYGCEEIAFSTPLISRRPWGRGAMVVLGPAMTEKAGDCARYPGETSSVFIHTSPSLVPARGRYSAPTTPS
jgi:hypothetical protein